MNLESLREGIKSGAYKATVGAVTDMVGGDLPNPVVTRGSFKAVPKPWACHGYR